VITFNPVIYKEGINYLVSLPDEACIALNRKGYIPVKGFVDGIPFRSTCIPRKDKRYVLFLDRYIRMKINKSEHDPVSLQIEFDPESRELPVPEDIELILAEKTGLFEEFMRQSSAHRNELIRWVENAKRPETRLKRIERLVEHMRECHMKRTRHIK
jgi:hypothetical protein